MQSSLWYWWLSHFVAFLASAPWPGCSLIYNQNIKSIVSPSRESVATLIKLTLSPGCGNHLATGREPKDAPTGGHAQASLLTGTQSGVFHKMFLVFLHGKGIRLKRLSHHRNWPGTSVPFNPFNTKLLLTLQTLPGGSDSWGAKTNQGEEDVLGASAPSGRLRERGLGRSFYFSNQIHTHNDNSLSRPCLLCWKPHSKHGLVCRREAATLFMLQVGLTEKPHQFVLK